jgi:hypothetical protein
VSPRAATLDQNGQQDDEDNTTDYPDHHGSIHIESPFPQWLKLV